MNTGNRTGRARLLREYVRHHPGCDSATAADALGLDRKRCANAMCKMARDGHFTQTPIPNPPNKGAKYTYTLARESLQPVLTREEAAKRRKERQAACCKRYTEKKRLARQAARAALKDERLPRVVPRPLAVVAEPVAYECSDEAIARGVPYEVLPGFQAVRYCRNPVRQAQRGARAIA